MRKILSAACAAIWAVCLLGLFGVRAYGQERDRDEDKGRASAQPSGIVHDWSHRHVVYPRVGSIDSLISVQHDPRAIQSWQEAEWEDWHRERRSRHHRDHDRDHDVDEVASGLHRDWAISLGNGSVAPAMYPAKFGFDPNVAADCANDFVVFPVNIAGSASQPNIVAFNQLYSGTAGGTGICNRGASGSDTGVAAETFWSYDINAAGGLVATSPALSIDGTKVAFVETVAGTSAHFHVLAWKSGDGVDAANLQNVLLPKAITSFTGSAPVAASGTATELSFGATGDTLSSPFVDYTKDVAYVGNDAGVLFRFKDVFCPTVPLIDAACAGGSPPAPSLDTTWNSTGSVTVGGTCTGVLGKLTGAVVDFSTGNVFVGCADGRLYGFTSSGAALTPAFVAVGDASATGGIVDPPLIDVVNGFAYAVSGSSGGSSVLVQAKTDFTSTSTATLGAAGLFIQHAPAFNAAYFSSGTPANWLIYDWATNGSNQSALYGVGFAAGHIMTAGPAGNVFAIAGSNGNELSPVTEFLNGATDQLFVSGIASDNPNFVAYNINTFPTTFPPIDGSNAVGATIAEGGGTSGIVVDNVSSVGQASSIYFGVLSTAGPTPTETAP